MYIINYKSAVQPPMRLYTLTLNLKCSRTKLDRNIKIAHSMNIFFFVHLFSCYPWRFCRRVKRTLRKAQSKAARTIENENMNTTHSQWLSRIVKGAQSKHKTKTIFTTLQSESAVNREWFSSEWLNMKKKTR